jgi:hypothetical protein
MHVVNDRGGAVVTTRVNVAWAVLDLLREEGLVRLDGERLAEVGAELARAAHAFRADPIELAYRAGAADPCFRGRFVDLRAGRVRGPDDYAEVLAEAAAATQGEWKPSGGPADPDVPPTAPAYDGPAPTLMAPAYDDPDADGQLSPAFVDWIIDHARRSLSGRYRYTDDGDSLLYLPADCVRRIDGLRTRLPGPDDVIDLLEATRTDPEAWERVEHFLFAAWSTWLTGTGPRGGWPLRRPRTDGSWPLDAPDRWWPLTGKTPDGRWPLAVAVDYGIGPAIRTILDHGGALAFLTFDGDPDYPADGDRRPKVAPRTPPELVGVIRDWLTGPGSPYR